MFTGIVNSGFTSFIMSVLGLVFVCMAGVCRADGGDASGSAAEYGATTPEEGAAYDSNDLAGTWYVHSLASGPGAPWWEHGWWSIEADHSFSGFIREYKGALDPISGRFLFASNGVATFLGARQDPDAVVFPHLHMAANKSVVAGVGAWPTDSPGTAQMIVLARCGLSYQSSDLEGTWYVHSLASGPGAPWWEDGYITVIADGSFRGMVRQYKSDSKEMSGRFQIDPNGVVTIAGLPQDPHADGYAVLHLSADKNVIVGVHMWSGGSPGTAEMKIFTRKGESYSTSDLAGRWYRHSIASGPGAPWSEYGPMDIGDDGSFNAPFQQQYNSTPDEWSGRFQIDSNGVVTLAGKSLNPYSNGYGVAHLSADKNVIAGIATWSSGSPGTSELMILTRMATAE